MTSVIGIALKDTGMRNALIEGLNRAGYRDNEIFVDGNIVGLVFDKPHTPQPISRIEETDWVIQRKNELLCKKSAQYDNSPDKIKAVRELAPEIYNVLLNSIGKTKELFEAFGKIKKYLN